MRNLEQVVAGGTKELVLEAKEIDAKEWIQAWREKAPTEARDFLIHELCRDELVRVEQARLEGEGSGGGGAIRLVVGSAVKVVVPVYEPWPWRS